MNIYEPPRGLEPPTDWLQISCSTNWATVAIQFFENFQLTYLNDIKSPPRNKILYFYIIEGKWQKCTASQITLYFLIFQTTFIEETIIFFKFIQKIRD